MVELTEDITLKNEDKCTEILKSIVEVQGLVNTLYSAVTNEGDPPEIEDVANAIYFLVERLQVLKNDSFEYHNFCIKSGLFGQTYSIKKG